MSISCTRNFFERFCVEGYNMDARKHSSFLSADLLPSLGARINQSTKLRKHIISPFDSRFRCFIIFRHTSYVYIYLCFLVFQNYSLTFDSGHGRCGWSSLSFTRLGFVLLSLHSSPTRKTHYSQQTTLSMASLLLILFSPSSLRIQTATLIFQSTILRKQL